MLKGNIHKAHHNRHLLKPPEVIASMHAVAQSIEKDDAVTSNQLLDT